MRHYLIALLFAPLLSWGQSETHDFIRYDTIINTGCGPFKIIIERPSNSDTASRPAIIFSPGQGEQNTTDTTVITRYGPFYWRRQGWDGGIQLANGRHYPILISISATTTVAPYPPCFYTVFQYIVSHYKIKPNAVHCTGYSQGAFSFGAMIQFEQTAGAESGMKLITSLAMLQGTPDPIPSPYSGWDRGTTAYKVWAKKYGGKYFYLEGNGSDNIRDGWKFSGPMNDTVPGCAYFSYESLGGGAHCCWNSMYDPGATNWTSVGTLGPNNAPSQAGTNTMGTYKAPSSVFQWMIRQGDTTMVTSGSVPPPISTPLVIKNIIPAEYRIWYVRSDSTLWAFNNGSANAVQCVVGGGLKIFNGSGGFNYFRVLDSAGWMWTSLAINFSIDPNSATKMLTDTTGGAFSGNIAVNAYGHVFTTIRADSSIWYGGVDAFSMFYTGGNLNAQTGRTMKPTQLSPAGMKFKKVQMANTKIIGLTTAGDVYVWTAGGSRTPTKMTLPRPAIDIFMSPLDAQGAIVPDVAGSQTMGYPYVWGTASSMWGGTGNYATPTAIKSLWNMTVPIREIAMDWNTIHYIDSAGKLWGCGFNSFGEVGNGQEFVNKYDYPNYPGYGWTLTNYEHPTGIPVQISTKTDWKHLYSNDWFGFYKTATDNNDSVYSWGRNKALVLGNGLNNYEEGGATDSASPNALDVLVPTMVHPLQATYVQYNFDRPTLSAGANRTITTNNTTLVASGNPALLIARSRPAANGIDTAGYSWISYAWTKLSGPNCTITSPSSKTTTITGMTTGTYVFRVLGTDNNTGQDTAQVQVIVSAATTPPTVNAGLDQVVTKPASGVTLTGTANGNGGATITSTSWTFVSGPVTPSITSPSSLSTAVTGMSIVGTYIFRLSATDSNSNTSSDTMTVILLSSANCNCVPSNAKVL